MNDLDLLRQYKQQGSEEAFATLVDRHLKLVYATALRHVRSPQLAEEAAQSAFLSLARNAGSLAPNTILAAWLYRVTRHAAIDLMRGEPCRSAFRPCRARHPCRAHALQSRRPSLSPAAPFNTPQPLEQPKP